MILTDREIKLYLRRGSIIIDPSPHAQAYSSTSVDLTLDPTISEFLPDTPGVERVIDPTNKAVSSKDLIGSLTRSVTIDAKNGYVLKPREFILGWTAEYVDLRYDACIAARVEGKSSLARLGIAVHMTAPIIHAGFDGRIRLEIINNGPLPVRLRSGMPFCQLVFEQTLGTPEQGYQGQFSGQK